jgi:septum formation protein
VALLTMRDFSDLYLDLYLQALGAQALQTVGAYHFEGLGAQLFERVQGDYFTILGLPLLPLLGALRELGALPQ